MLDIDSNWRILCPDFEVRWVKLVQVGVTTCRKERCVPPLCHWRSLALRCDNELRGLQHKERTHPNILLQRIELTIQSCLSSTFRNTLFQGFQLCVLSNLVGERHVFSLGVKLQRSSNALARCAFESGFGRRASSGRSVRIFLSDGRRGRRCRWRRRYIARISANRGKFGLHRFVAVFLRLRRGDGGVEQERMRRHLKTDTLRCGLCTTTLPAGRRGCLRELKVSQNGP